MQDQQEEETPLQHVMQQRPLGLVFDIDGTLSPIAPTPAEARLHPAARSLLEQARSFAHVAIITGRSVVDGAAMVNVEGLTYIGTHGLEWCDGLPSEHPVQVTPAALAYIEPGRHLLDLAEHTYGTHPGILVERKRVGGSIHYRLSPDPDQMRADLFALLEQPAQEAGMLLREGKRVIEIKPPVAANKGDGVRRFVERYALQGILFAGDDRTDLDAMLELARLRTSGLATFSIAVQHPDTIPQLLQQADLVVQEVDGMINVLRGIVSMG
jgi:trehalose 6-phosphate phosphatase